MQIENTKDIDHICKSEPKEQLKSSSDCLPQLGTQHSFLKPLMSTVSSYICKRALADTID